MEEVTKCFPLHHPPLAEVAEVLEAGLKKNFADVTVSVVDCPDLSEPPFRLAAKGLCGSPKVADVGGVPNLLPLPQKDKMYSLVDVARQVGTSDGLVVGAGAAPWPLLGTNAELMANVKMADSPVIKSAVALMDKENEGQGQVKFIDTDQFALMANLYMCEGKPGKVLEVKAKQRTGAQNYMSCIRETLAARYGDQPVALGGSFLVEKGKARLHIMPEFSDKPLMCDADVDGWLKFFEYDAPLVAVGYLISHDPGLELRIEHFHCYSDHNMGGHYHCDVTPDEVEYRGYFSVAESLYRVDPAVAQQ